MASLGLRSLAGALLITLGGCDSIAYRTIEIQRADSSSRTAVSQVVGEFAQKEGFSCYDASTSVRECRALGPRFLSVTSKGDATVVELAQPYPGTKASEPP